ncbi:PAS domain S-box protein [Natronomonas halophila]|uniref:PAS domain S-box protein n=1 Tax=Natronomonas halophila TaxID=2747817 RepID=UPI0015B743E3|nr:PAS domain S-box protein [Natronomonas halophila]QLD86072.1 PAS domain S-box protein [Natronomonas halophila]
MSPGIRVLLVDDDDAFRETVARHLEREEFDIATASGAAPALDALDGTVECVVSDYEMPDASGLDLLAAIRDQRPSLPFVLFTGTSEEGLVDEAFAAGATDFVRKHPNADTYTLLARRIEHAVEDHGPAADREATPAPAEYRHFLDAIGDPAYMTDAEGRIMGFNERAAELTGYDPDEVVGEPVSMLLSPSDIERGEAVIRDLLSGSDDRTATYDMAVETADSGTIDLENHVALLTDDGTFRGTIGVLRRSENRTDARLRRLHDATRELMATADTDEVATLTLEAAQEILGQSIATVRLHEDGMLVPSYSTDEVEEMFRVQQPYPVGVTPLGKAFEAGEPRVEPDFSTVEDDYDHGPIQSAAYFPLGDHGVLSIASTERDAFDEADLQLATVLAANAEAALDRAAKETRLRKERDDLEALFENIPDPTVEAHMKDGKPIVKRANPAFEEVFGYDSDEIAGENLDEFIVPPDVDDDPNEFNERIQRGESLHGEVRRQTADGLRDFILHVVPHDVGKRVTRGYAIYTDITEQKQRERELARQNERLDQFASVVSHDLRNPLSVARGRLELARETGEDEHFEATEHAHDRMEELIDGLLALARQGELTDDPIPVDLESAAKSAWETADTRDLDLSFDDPGIVVADPERLRQLLENLFRNATEHAEGATTVTVGGLPNGFYVADDGPGIPESEREAVLESGYSKGGGTGFGLAIVDTIADAHDWDVTVTESDAGGARFEFTDEDPTAG